jgi:hypothetical protein
MSPHEPRYGTQALDPPPQPGLEAGDAWKELIARYLAERRDVPVPYIFGVLDACERDEILRAKYLRLARGSQ